MGMVLNFCFIVNTAYFLHVTVFRRCHKKNNNNEFQEIVTKKCNAAAYYAAA